MTRDEFLTKAMGWHWQPATLKVGDALIAPWRNPDFSNAADFVTLLLWSQDDARVYVPQGGPEKWTWEDFADWTARKYIGAITLHPGDVYWAYMDWSRWLFNPQNYSKVLAEFLGFKQEM